MRTWTTLAATLALGLSSAACGGGGEGESPMPDAAPAPDTAAAPDAMPPDAAVPPDAAAPPDARRIPDAQPPPPDAEPPRPFGAECTRGNQCQGRVCVADFGCSEQCSLEATANSCQHVDAFCITLTGGTLACYGEIETGDDEDGQTITIDETRPGHFHSLGDADLYKLDFWRAGEFLTEVKGDTVDLQIELYNRVGDPTYVANNNTSGESEGVVNTFYEPGYVFLVVRNVGNNTGSYSISMAEYNEARHGSRPMVRHVISNATMSEEK